MKTVVYLDLLLLVNFLIAYFLLQAAGLLCGGQPTFGRSLLGAGLAACATLILLAPPLPLWAQLAWNGLTALGVVRAAFCWRGLGRFLRQGLWYFALNLALAGAVILGAVRGVLPGAHTNNLAVYLQVSPWLLLGCALAVYLAARGALLLLGRREPGPRQKYALQVRLPQGALTLETLRDTGFTAREPLSGAPLLLASYPALRGRLPPALAEWLAAWFAGRAPQALPGLPLRLAPLHTAAGSLLAPAFRLPVGRAGGEHTVLLPVAFCDQLFEGGAVEGLAGDEFFEKLEEEGC